MKFIKILSTFASVCLMGLMADTSRAQNIIGLKVTTSSSSYADTMFTGDFAGAPGVRTNNWNNMLVVNGNTISYITNTAGTIIDCNSNVISGMQAIWFIGGGGSDGFFNRLSPATSTNDGKMFGDVADVYPNNSFANYGYLDITNIPYTNYNVYCYFRDDNGNGSGNTRGGFYLITNTPSGSQRIYIQNQSNDVAQTQYAIPATTGSGYVQSTTTAIPSGGAAWSAIQGGNYGVFTGLTNSYTRIWFGGLGNGSAGKDDLGNYVNGGSAAVRFKVPAFQIVQVNGGLANSLYLQNPAPILHAGNPAGTQVAVLANLNSGATGVNVTQGSTFSSDNPGVLAIGAGGMLEPGTNGTAHLIVNYQTLSITNVVTVIGPTSLSISLANTNLLAGNGQGDTTTATLYANFSDAANVPVNSFNYVSFSSSPNGIVSTSTNGVVTALTAGTFSITGTYDGLSVTTNNAGVVTAWLNPASVPAISVHFTGSGESMLFHDLSGDTGVRSGYWNNFVQNTGNVTNQLNNPTDDQGNVLSSTVVQVVPDFGGVLDNQTLDTAGTVTTNESVLFGVLLDYGMNNGTTVPSQLVVSNIPYASYDVYFYIWNDTSATNRPAEFTIDGVTQYRINSAAYPAQPANNGTGYVIAAPQTGSLPASIVNVPFGNVIKFTGVTDSTLVAQWAAIGQDYIGDANSVTRVRLAGFQIVKSLDGLTATKIYLSPGNVPAQLPGNPATYGLTVLANFSDGTMGGNITSLPGVTYASSNTNIFGVDTNGNITPGLTPGTAVLTVTYQTNNLMTTVTNLSPISAQVTASPATVYLNSIIGVQPAQANLLVTFAGYTNVNVGTFNSVSFVDQGSAAATLATSGVITADAVGQANLGASYLGTSWVSPNAFTVAETGGSPVLMHQYNFHDAVNSTTVVDSIGGANGTIYPPNAPNLPITLDGQRAIFPGDAAYNNEPWISLPSGLISNMGDVTIELWCGQSQLNAWARFLAFGNTPKGNNPQVLGGTATSGIQILASYAGAGHADFTGAGDGDFLTPFTLTNGVEYQVVIVCAPNTGTSALYVNGILITNGIPTPEYLSTLVDDTVDWLGVSLSNNDSPLAGWISNLAIYEGVMPASQVLSDYNTGISLYPPPVSGPATNTVPVTFSVSGGNLNLNWPGDHLGWTLQVQTNALNTGLGTNWVNVSGSTSVTNEVIPVNPANGAVFYRLVYP